MSQTSAEALNLMQFRNFIRLSALKNDVFAVKTDWFPISNILNARGTNSESKFEKFFQYFGPLTKTIINSLVEMMWEYFLNSSIFTGLSQFFLTIAVLITCLNNICKTNFMLFNGLLLSLLILYFLSSNIFIPPITK